MKKAELYLQGEVVKVELISTDKQTYMAPILVFKILTGRFKGETIAVFENGGKFMGWV